MTTERFVFDFDELDAQGLPRCPVAYLFPEPPTPAMLEVVGPYLRLRDRGRRILVEHAIRNLELAGDRMTAHLMYDGGPEPRLLGAIVTGQSKPPEKRYEYDELNAWLLPGEATIDLGGGAPPLKARGIRVVPIREVTEPEPLDPEIGAILDSVRSGRQHHLQVEPSSPLTGERLKELAVTAGTRLARNSPEGIAIMRATIAASPYQQCRKAHGCGHPCSCPIRNTTTERKES